MAIDCKEQSYILYILLVRACELQRICSNVVNGMKGMCLLLGHHRIMEATLATLVMMVLKEVVKVVLGNHRSRQPSRKS